MSQPRRRYPPALVRAQHTLVPIGRNQAANSLEIDPTTSCEADRSVALSAIEKSFAQIDATAGGSVRY